MGKVDVRHKGEKKKASRVAVEPGSANKAVNRRVAGKDSKGHHWVDGYLVPSIGILNAPLWVVSYGLHAGQCFGSLNSSSSSFTHK